MPRVLSFQGITWSGPPAINSVRTLCVPVPYTVAQVIGLAETFSAAREALEAAPADTGGGGDDKTTSPGDNAHTLEGHRQTMAGVVPRLYQILSNAVEADEARSRSQEGGGGGGNNPGVVVTERVRAVLHGKPWLWVGDAFVPADQVMKKYKKSRVVIIGHQQTVLYWVADIHPCKYFTMCVYLIFSCCSPFLVSGGI